MHAALMIRTRIHLIREIRNQRRTDVTHARRKSDLQVMIFLCTSNIL